MAKKLSEQAQKALRLFEEGCLAHHTNFCEKLRERENAYHSIIEIASDAAEWTSKLHPPFVGHIVESTLAGLVDDRFTFRVKPRPRLLDPGEFRQLEEGADAHEILHGNQFKDDRFSEKQWPFALQDAIAGITGVKNFWRREKMRRPVLKMEDAGEGLGIFIPKLVESEELVTQFDGPTSEVLNMEDFFWHEAATELQKSPIVAHRVWTHFADLKRLEKDGVYRNVDELKEQRGSEEKATRFDGTSRSKDMLEVLEIWWREPDGIHTVTLGERAVELKAPRKNPFWHGEYPFVICSTRPDLFAIPGKSQVEKIAHLQEAHWDLENQTRDNLRLLNNFMLAFNTEMIPDPDALEPEPGARFAVNGPLEQALKTFAPDPISAQIAIPHLSRLETQMQNLAASQPFSSTSEAGSVGADTATEAALVTNLAQRSTMRLKQQLYYAYERIGQQRTYLNQQFIRTTVMAEKIGLDSESEWHEIAPYLLQGDYLFDISPMNESLMRSERKAEINTALQMFLQVVPVAAQLSQMGAATPLNLDEMVREWLETNDFRDPDRFFSAQPQQLPGGAAGTPPPGAPPETPPNGVTAQQSIDPAVSPSGQASLSGQTMLSRALAQTGGVNNSG